MSLKTLRAFPVCKLRNGSAASDSSCLCWVVCVAARSSVNSSLIASWRSIRAINVALVAITMGGGKAGLYAMFASFFFMSVGFPTIFALGIRGLGEHTKLASSLIVMSIVGGAIAPPFMGHIADRHTMRLGFVVPLVCFGFVALYGMMWASLSKKDILSGTESH